MNLHFGLSWAAPESWLLLAIIRLVSMVLFIAWKTFISFARFMSKWTDSHLYIGAKPNSVSADH
jgi:hypothetical protein